MTLEEFYNSIGGDYNQVFDQLGDDSVICEFLNKFFDKKSEDTINELELSLLEKRYKEAFMYVHNIKGYGLNMSLTPLHKAAHELCEALRNGTPAADLQPLFNKLKSAFYDIKALLPYI